MTSRSPASGVSRRSMLAAAGAATVTAPLAAPAVARAEETISWTMVTAWPKGAPGVGGSADRFAAMVEAMSGGRLAITVYGAG